jgi:hypothetical protein
MSRASQLLSALAEGNFVDDDTAAFDSPGGFSEKDDDLSAMFRPLTQKFTTSGVKLRVNSGKAYLSKGKFNTTLTHGGDHLQVTDHLGKQYKMQGSDKELESLLDGIESAFGALE